MLKNYSVTLDNTKQAEQLHSTIRSASLSRELENQEQFKNALLAAYQRRRPTIVTQVTKSRELNREANNRHYKNSRINELLLRIASLKSRLSSGGYDRSIAAEISLLQTQLMYLIMTY